MPLSQRVGLLMVASLAVGCGPVDQPRASEPVSKTTTAEPTSLESRFAAANAITSTEQKCQALAKVALDAARATDLELTKKSLQAINLQSVQEDTAYDSAVELAKRGKVEQAKEVAGLIRTTGRKDAALARIASGG